MTPHLGRFLIFAALCAAWATPATLRAQTPTGSLYTAQVRDHRTGAWWTMDGQHEIDIVALGPDGQVLLAECKWGDVTRDDIGRLEARVAKILPDLGTVRKVHLALFVGGQVDPQIQPRIDAGELLLFTVADLFAV